MAVPKFHDPLDTRASSKDKFILLLPYRYTTLALNEGRPTDIEAPKGFDTDFASIPQLFRSFIPVNGRHRGAAVIHDYLYRTASEHHYTRLECDTVFLEAMKVAGVPWWKRNAMFLAVRTSGWLHFKREKK